MQFEFATANRIIFGPGTQNLIGSLAQSLGDRVIVVTGKTIDRTHILEEALHEAGVSVYSFIVSQEPTTHLVAEGARLARQYTCNCVIGFGGGSVLDAAKAIAALTPNDGVPLDYLEVIGKGKPLKNKPIPCLAIPTTAGTGAEVTKNAVLFSPEHRVKVSLRSPMIMPTVALVDPLLTHTMPPNLTAYTGLDAFTQVLEPYVSLLANPVTDGFCREGIKRVGRSLHRAFTNGYDSNAREDMALASLFGGLSLANAKLGAVHGFAGVLGGMFDVSHGLVCGRLLPYVVKANVNALLARDKDNPVIDRFIEIGKLVCGHRSRLAEDAATCIEKFVEDLNIPGLANFGINQEYFPEIIQKTQLSSSMKGNPIKLTDEELAGILNGAL